MKAKFVQKVQNNIPPVNRVFIHLYINCPIFMVIIFFLPSTGVEYGANNTTARERKEKKVGSIVPNRM
jgi:hypothetical protein